MSVRLTIDVGETVGEVQAAVMGLTLINLAQLQKTALPDLYESDVKYTREPIGRERWQTITETIARKKGDCEDLAAARCAQLRHAGEDATINVTLVRPGLMHIRVRRADGSLEDPSKKLGMGRP